VRSGLDIKWVISEAGNTCKIFGHSVDICQVSTSHCPNVETPELLHKDIAYSMTTSGTTGNPKQVFVPHKAIVPNIIYFRFAFFIDLLA
jgi:acyl-coenzyme A synthetase/AMP-(fatty) acid ligase